MRTGRRDDKEKAKGSEGLSTVQPFNCSTAAVAAAWMELELARAAKGVLELCHGWPFKVDEDYRKHRGRSIWW